MALLKKGNGGMQVMSAMEKLEFQEYFLQKLNVAAQLRVLYKSMSCHRVLLLFHTLRDNTQVFQA